MTTQDRPPPRREGLAEQEDRNALMQSLLARVQDKPQGIPRQPRAAPLPLSFAQQRLWFLQRLEPASSAYHVPALLRLQGNLDVDVLRAALATVVRRHETLRTTFNEVAEQPLQVIHPATALDLPLRDLTALPEAQRAAELQQALAEARRPFALERDWPLRATLLRLGPADHALVLILHHIAADGWSLEVMVRELAALYPALRAGQPAPLAELPIQYADFAVWQRAALRGEALAKLLTYWRAQLADAPPLLLPGTRAAHADQAGEQRFFAVPEALADALLALARRQDVTPFMLLLAAFQVLLSRYSGQDDLCIGTAIANRRRVELEPLIGFFVNTLVLRADLSGNPRFADYLQQVKQTALAAYAHQDLPFERLVEALGRQGGHNPLVTVLLTVQNGPIEAFQLGAGLTATVQPLANGDAKFDLALDMRITPAGLCGSWEYRSARFSAADIDRLAGHFTTLLASIAAAPDTRIQALDLLSAREQYEWRARHRGIAPPAPPLQTLIRLFERQAARAPDAIALIFDTAALSYRQLNERASRIAWRLQDLGAGPETVVGLCTERSLAMIEGLLAILKAGAVYLPLDPDDPSERLAFMLENARASIVLTQQSLLDGLPLAERRALCLDEAEDPAAPSTNPSSAVTADNLAYLIYTSGSTGAPKAVAVSQRALAEHCQNVQRHYQLGAADRVLQFASLSFDQSLEQILPSLIAGAALVLRGPEHWDSAHFTEVITRFGLTVINLPPAYWRRWQQDQVCTTAPPATLRLVIIGGDVLWARDLERWTIGPRLLNAYGPTEATITALTHDLAGPVGAERIPIGQPLPGRRAYILDRDQAHPVPTGVVGELYLGGAGLARGYLGLPGLTAERFVPDPFSAEPGARLYRTGDLARYRADGGIEFLGRGDLQVKLRGFRIELGEIEAALARHPAVREAAVTVAAEAGGEQRLVAHVVPQAGVTAPSAGALRQFLLDKLPRPLVPAVFTTLPALPLRASGKIDRQALAALAVPHSAPERAWAAPRTPTEELIAGLWRELLALDRVGSDDDFFALGGHSLLALQLLSRLRAALAVDLPLRALFDSPTLAALAKRIDAARRGDQQLALPPLTPAHRTGAAPLSFAQQRLWFLQQLQPQSTAYNIPAALRLSGPLDAVALAQSLNDIIRRHESLRTRFVAENGEPRQIVVPVLELALPVEDLQHLPPAEQAAVVQDRASAAARHRFDLEREVLLRAALLRLSATEHVLLVTLHHIVSDGGSVQVLLRELAACYQAASSGHRALLPELAVQYADFALWQRRWLQGEVRERQLAYWRRQLAGAPALLELPSERPRAAELGYQGEFHAFRIDAALTREIKALGQRARTTLFMTLLAGFAAVLARYSGSHDVVIGSPVANRNHLQLEPLIGFFANTLALRIDLGGEPTAAELLRRVRQTCLDAYTHQDLPFEQLLEALQPERDLSHSPLFQVMLVVHEAAALDALLPGITVSPLAPLHFTAKFDITLTLEDGPQGLAGLLEFNRELFAPEAMARLAGHFREMLAALAGASATSIFHLPMLAAHERRQWLETWNASRAVFPQHLCIHHLIEAQAARTPDAVAVVCGPRQITYRGLNAEADRLACHLRSLGVGPGLRVGICVERSLAMVIGLLGILKAGGAYVPLDPHYPSRHLALLIEDARLAVLLTQAQWRAALPQTGARVVDLDGDWQTPEALPTVAASASDPAYVIFTSGTTGRSKAAGVSHQSFVNLLHWYVGAFGLASADRTLVMTSLSFDLTQKNLYAPLMLGGTLHLAPPEAYDPQRLLEHIARCGITWINCTPSAFYPLLEQDAVNAFAQLRSLRYVFLGGEAIAPAALRAWIDSPGQRARIVNTYGPTECADVCAACMLEPTPHAHTVPIGKPIANARLYVLDSYGEPVPVGVEGELYVGGTGVGLGYLNDAALTAARFLPDPFGAEPGARLYKTGDRVRYSSDGNLEWRGRGDQQLKVRGFRIEPGAVEAVLLQHPAVQRAVVVTRADYPDQLLAYWVAKPGQEAQSGELRAYLGERLPQYAVPARFVTLAALPLSANGKVDLSALPAPAERGAEPPGAPPQSTTERQVAEIWRALLGVAEVGIHDNFFDLGGHSLLMPKVCARLREVLEVDLPLLALFRYPTVHALACHLSQAADANGIQQDATNRAARRTVASPQRERRRQHRSQRPR